MYLPNPQFHFPKTDLTMKRTTLPLLLLLLTGTADAQQIPNWQNLDLKNDGIFGISTEKAYSELLKDKTPKQVIVAVIDAGVDTAHEDLKSVLWINPKKKAFDNGTYGWSYIGSAKGNVHYDNLELTRQVRQFAADTTRLSASDLNAYHAEKKSLTQQFDEAEKNRRDFTNYAKNLDFLASAIGKDDPSVSDLNAFQPKNDGQKGLRDFVVANLTRTGQSFAELRKGIDDAIAHFKEQTDYQLNTAYDPRPLYVGDDYFDSKQKNYGSPDNNGPDPTHGTHVSGIIGAVRHNGIGIDGIADEVRILNIRAVPDGDERDKDIANAIRYAADHGAKIINMSFGKAYSQDKKAVDQAVQYALKKDVLLIQAAGNSNENIDSVPNFPNRKYLDGREAGAYIVVGASGMKNDSTIKAPFSNYGKQAVDVFAPGEQIYSTIPGSKYAYFDGTSMAAPVVSGLAALIREYHPKLSAIAVKQIIMESIVPTPYLQPYCRTGGVVNAYNALALAAERDQN